MVQLLDAELAIRDGKDHAFYAVYNKIDDIKHAVVAYSDNVPAGCGAMKKFSSDSMEVKRMFVRPEFRNNGIARMILAELESWAFENSFRKCVLETGKMQPEAIALYLKCGYIRIPNYGQYVGVNNSVCFEKDLEKFIRQR